MDDLELARMSDSIDFARLERVSILVLQLEVSPRQRKKFSCPRIGVSRKC